MKDGKLSEVAFKRSVLMPLKKINGRNDSPIVMKTAVLTGNEEGVAYLAVVRAMNALAAAGAEPQGLTITFSLPGEFLDDTNRFLNGAAPDPTENGVKALMAEVERALVGKNVTISDIAVEVTKNSLITVAVTACGQKREMRPVKGKNIVMVGLAAAAGSAMLSIKHKSRLIGKYNRDFLTAADALLQEADVSRKIHHTLQKEEYATVLVPVSDGGIFGAIWSLCDSLECGCEIEIKDIAIKQVTIEICEFFDVNPYIMLGDGAFIYVTDKEADQLEEGVIIGHLTDNADRVVRSKETRSFLTPVREDAYYECR